MLIKTIEELKGEVKDLKKLLLQHLSRSNESTQATQNRERDGWPEFPLDTLANFRSWEQFLSVEDNFNYAVSNF